MEPQEGLRLFSDAGIRHPWKGRIEPFQLIGNLYFVGTVPASAHLIDTGEGLLLIDSALPQSTYLILEGMRRLGFDPADLRWILHSHGHYDHIGSTRALVELTGAKTYISRLDAPLATGELNLTWANEMGCAFNEAFEPDGLIEDGDVLEFGNTRIECVLTPGHTLGTLSFFWNIEGAHEPLTAAMFGGTGHNTMERDWLAANHMPLDMPERYRAGLHCVFDRRVDVFVGNHLGHNRSLEKLQERAQGVKFPFVDRGEWQRFLLSEERSLDEMLAREAARARGMQSG